MAKEQKGRERSYPFPHGDDGETIVDALAGESDRAVPLIASEFLSRVLEELLRVTFKKSGATDKQIKSWLWDGPVAYLYHFSPRIDLSFAFGAIGPQTHQVLVAVRKIRNDCAHRTKVSLKSPRIQGHVSTLEKYLDSTTTKAVRDSSTEMWSVHGEDMSSNSKERNAILLSTYFLYGRILAQCLDSGSGGTARLAR